MGLPCFALRSPQLGFAERFLLWTARQWHQARLEGREPPPRFWQGFQLLGDMRLGLIQDMLLQLITTTRSTPLMLLTPGSTDLGMHEAIYLQTLARTQRCLDSNYNQLSSIFTALIPLERQNATVLWTAQEFANSLTACGFELECSVNSMNPGSPSQSPIAWLGKTH